MAEKVFGDQPILESDLWCTSDVRISNTTFMWKIKGFKFSNYTYNLEGIKTGVFVIRGGEGDIKRDTKWMLEIKPGTILTTGGQHIRVNLHSKNIGITKPDVVLQMVNSSKARQVFGTVRKIHTFIGESSCELISDELWCNMLRDDYLIDGDLNFALDFNFTYSSSVLGSKWCREEKVINYKLSESISNFFLSDEMSDVQIHCGDNFFDAHQLILSIWSPVFRLMFKSKMKEKETKIIEICDLDPDVVQELLKFMYIGRCCIHEKDPDPQTVADILAAADKYQVDVLKRMCEEKMISILLPTNSLQILEYADIYRVEELKARAMDLVVINMQTIRISDEWKELAKKRPQLYVDISEALADRM